ncbi:unnamed protein product [Clonostachys byssicola]|uniref:Bacteriophage T5 Orf172 DNA-binding domain-containing protein n=1 Tax=Clonostachys byssicola TaxID=160290 RepID=A0A9N9UKX3_9HYPO|nr:unnamed protein product [Clonostachys byssicola]
MAFIPNTPESSFDRSDSLDPNATCRGITTSGKPCRRPIPNAQPSPSRHGKRRPQTPDPRDENSYCWQHKDQASMSAHSSPGPRGTATPILQHQRTSLDTLADRLGLIDLQDKKKRKSDKTQQQDSGYRPSKPQKQKASFCCCFGTVEEPSKSAVPVRPQPRPVQKQSASVPSAQKKSKSSRKSGASFVSQAKDLIPDSLDPTTASALMTELARPYVDSDQAGYIYMFWLTPTSSSGSMAVPGDAARDLLAPPSPTPRSRRASDVVNSYADKNESKAAPGAGGKPMVLKIGRAANVHRRMVQWQRQCGRDVEVLRYYPYSPSASGSVTSPRPTPHAHRVERLIHIELAGMGLRADLGTCDACGREHREWFQVEATRAAVRKVDGIIRKWVEWDERNV